MWKLTLGYGTSNSFLSPTYYDNRYTSETKRRIISFNLLILIPTIGVRAIDMR